MKRHNKKHKNIFRETVFGTLCKMSKSCSDAQVGNITNCKIQDLKIFFFSTFNEIFKIFYIDILEVWIFFYR